MANNKKFRDFIGSGVYSIINKVNNKIYIGSTRRQFRERWSDHLRDLKSKNHCNHYLQRAWEKYGEDAFEFSVLEEIPSEILKNVKGYQSMKEQFWIDKFKPFDSAGYNIATKADCPNPRTFTYQDRIDAGRQSNPDGYLVTFPNSLIIHTYNLSLFVEENKDLNLQISGMTACARGEQPEHKGFKCCFANPKDRIEYKPKPEKENCYVLYSPIGERYETNNLTNFCDKVFPKELKGCRPRLSSCALSFSNKDYSYKRTHVNNWTCYYLQDDPGFINKEDREKLNKYTLISPNGEIINVANLPAFAKEKGLNYRVLLKCSNPKYPNKTYKGWQCSKYEDVKIEDNN